LPVRAAGQPVCPASFDQEVVNDGRCGNHPPRIRHYQDLLKLGRNPAETCRRLIEPLAEAEAQLALARPAPPIALTW
jgi:hypothetical protein